MKDSEVNVFVTEDSLREPKWRPDSCWSWLVCAASSVSIVIVSGIGYSFGLLLPPLIEHFETTRQATGNKITVLQLHTFVTLFIRLEPAPR